MLKSIGLSSAQRSFSKIGVLNTTSSINFRRNLSDDLRKKFDQLVKENDVVVFMKGSPKKPMCGFSRAVIQILDAEGLDRFETINVLANEEVRSGIKEYSSWPTIPQVYIKGEFIGGFDIMLELHKKEELRKMLLEKGILKE